MADDRKRQDRPVLRVFERRRLEHQLLTLAYQHIVPVVRKRIGAAKRQKHAYDKTRIQTDNARRA